MIKYEVVATEDATGKIANDLFEFEGEYPHSSHLRAIMIQLDERDQTLVQLTVLDEEERARQEILFEEFKEWCKENGLWNRVVQSPFTAFLEWCDTGDVK